MPPKKRYNRREASSCSDLSSASSVSSEASADSDDFSSSSSSEDDYSQRQGASSSSLHDDDDDDQTAVYDGARLAFARKVRREFELLSQQSPTYASSIELSSAVDIVAAKISKYCFAPENTSDPLPAGSRALFPHQLRALQWFRSLFANDCNGILADEMGLGKTMSAAAVLADIFHEAASNGSRALPAIIVAPLSTLDTWKNELSQSAAAHLRVVVFNGDAVARTRILQDKNFDVIITNPDVLVRQPHVLSQHTAWSCLIVDEAHRLKNCDSFLHMLLSAGFSSQRKILLTGTPVHNNLRELGSLLHFCNPSIFPTAVSFESLMGGGLDILAAKAICAPFLLRRTKADINLMLPPKRRVTIMLPLQPLQQHLYAGILRRCAPALADSSASFLRNILASLRKACSHPYLFTGIEPEPFEEGDHLLFASNKLAALACLLPKVCRAAVVLRLINSAAVEGRWTPSSYFFRHDTHARHCPGLSDHAKVLV
jgi:SNF2 family DNA or RNA helicase